MDYVIILAEGKGTRTHASKAKGMMPILGKPMIQYMLDALLKISFKKIICVFGNEYSDFNPPSCVDVVLQEEPFEAIDEVKAVFSKLEDNDGDVLLFHENTPFMTSKTIEELMQFHKNNNNLLTISTIRLDSPFGYGRVIREQNQIVRITEEKDAIKEEKYCEVYNGLMCLKTSVLKDLISHTMQKEKSLIDLVEIVSRRGKVGTYEIKDTFEVKQIQDLYSLSMTEQELQKRILQKHMLKGVRIENPNTVIIGPDVVFLGEAIVHPNTVILGHTTIYPYAVLGPNSEIQDSIVFDYVKVSHSVIYNSSIGKETTIGPFAHIRNNCYIGEANRIGNFVEFKNTSTGYKTYASHLSYVGDTRCGSGVNFGCGTITVNYDGEKKHKTTIGNNVFIGCNSNLIAPIEIESNSYIAAGSTITSSLENGDFAIARSKQITKSNYAIKFHYKRVEEE